MRMNIAYFLPLSSLFATPYLWTKKRLPIGGDRSRGRSLLGIPYLRAQQSDMSFAYSYSTGMLLASDQLEMICAGNENTGQETEEMEGRWQSVYELRLENHSIVA